MKIRVPHTVQIGPKLFIIEYVKILTYEEDPNKDELCGLCLAPEQRLKISLSQHASCKALLSTVFHEYLHGMLYVSGQAELLTHGMPGTQEEGLVIVHESYLSDMIDWKHKTWGDWKTVTLHK